MENQIDQNLSTFSKDLENQIFLLRMRKIQSIENAKADCKVKLGNAHNQLDFAFKTDPRRDNFLEVFSQEASSTMDRIEGEIEDYEKKLGNTDISQKLGIICFFLINIKVRA